jgi:hypothetical protein
MAGTAAASGMGKGGGVFLASGANVTINDTHIAGNTASTADNDVSGTLSVSPGQE